MRLKRSAERHKASTASLSQSTRDLSNSSAAFSPWCRYHQGVQRAADDLAEVMWLKRIDLRG